MGAQLYKDILEIKNKQHQEQMKKAHGFGDTNIFSEDDFKTLCKKYFTMSTQAEVLRVQNEFFGHGPLEVLIQNEEVTEILVNDYENIYFEVHGQLHKLDDSFYSQKSYEDFIERLCRELQTFLNNDKPYHESDYRIFRLTMIYSSLTGKGTLLSFRRQRHQTLTHDKLIELETLTSQQVELLKDILAERRNFIVVGETGSGKTSLLQYLMSLIPLRERVIIIEDTKELQPINPLHVRLLTYRDHYKVNNEVSLNDLVARSLRLRPDRLCIGEIRGGEATALLMALSTGHEGSFGTLHACTPFEALLRLEMLIQVGAPEWSTESIRKLIFLTIKRIIVMKKVNGKRYVEGIYELQSLETNGFIVHKIDDERKLH